MIAHKKALFLSTFVLSGCFVKPPQKLNAPASMHVNQEKMMTATKANLISTTKTPQGLALNIEYDLFCAPGLALIAGDQSKVSNHGMPLTQSQATELVTKAAGVLGTAQRKRTYDPQSKTPTYVVLPTDSAVVFDPRRLKVGEDLSDITAEWKACGKLGEEAAVDVRIMINEKDNTLQSLSKGRLNFTIDNQPQTTIIGKIEFRASTKQPPIEPLYFESSIQDLQSGLFKEDVFKRLRQENAKAGTSASAFGMRWNVTHLAAVSDWKTCADLGFNITTNDSSQASLANIMNQKSISRRIKAPIVAECATANTSLLSRLQTRC